MKKLLAATLIILFAASGASAKYNDYRGHNLDSLERVIAGWTPDKQANATVRQLIDLNRAYRDLMLGYEQINGIKSAFYARKALEISEARHWELANQDAYRYIGMHFYAQEKYDSALFYYNKAVGAIDRMENGATSSTNPEGYSEREIDDAKSALYGTMGNLYNMMDDLPKAMDYYEKAGAIFEKYGWNESNSILYYNIGETWVDAGEPKKAKPAYEKALRYALASGDSLMIANVYKGFGNLYSYQGKTTKALKYLQKADEYYIHHAKEEREFRMETMDYMSQVLKAQKSHLSAGIIALAIILILASAATVAGHLLKKARRQQAETDAMMDETLEDIRRMRTASPNLNDRERNILRLVASGCTNKQIADEIFLSPETIKWYRKRLLAKFDASNSAELISKAKEQGLV
jgi:DNA-binding CsgD family transcriptional regulator